MQMIALGQNLNSNNKKNNLLYQASVFRKFYLIQTGHQILEKSKLKSYLAQASARVCTMEAFVLKRSSCVMPGKLTEKGKLISNKSILCFLLEVQNNVPEAFVPLT